MKDFCTCRSANICISSTVCVINNTRRWYEDNIWFRGFRLTRSETCGRLHPWWASCPESDFGSTPTLLSDPARQCSEESCPAPETWCSPPAHTHRDTLCYLTCSLVKLHLKGVSHTSHQSWLRWTGCKSLLGLILKSYHMLYKALHALASGV